VSKPSLFPFNTHHRLSETVIVAGNVRYWGASSTGRRNTLSKREKIDYRPISQRFRGGTRAAEKITLWDSWLRRDSLKPIGRAFGKPSSVFIASSSPVLRRPFEITGVKRTLAGTCGKWLGR